MAYIIVFAVMVLLLYILLQGAPYVPTKQAAVEAALDMLDAPKGSLLVDVGCGDGRFLNAAARRGYTAVGIEIHPLFWLIAKVATWPYRKNVTVVFGNIFSWQLPPATRGVFMFFG